ncbi:MAG TPA: LLM class flavin-dependent oxidoreductase [Candidatus Acidoferrales bacterium]|nr:LLM class flavin-dependent oxidoreductase [Candidatus Acidoferrales bacterium]
MKLGVLLFPSPGGSGQLARMVEGLGFDSLVFADTQNITPEVWGQLMLAARDTERIELGTGVTNPGTRDAAVTASAALALQVESRGRAICGIGRGDSSLAKIGRTPVSVEEFERYVERLQRYLRGDEVDREGTASRLEWHSEVQLPKVPLEIAATGRRVIEMAARHADRIVFALGADEERLARAIDTARRAATASGRDPDTLKLGAWINSVVHPDIKAARAAVRGGLSAFAHFSGFKGMKPETMDPALRDAALHLRSNYDVRDHGRADTAHAQALDDDFVDKFGIVGPVETALPRFERLKALGLDFCRVVPGSRDALPEVVTASMMTLSTIIRQALA